MPEKKSAEKPFWQSTKFYYALLALAAFLALSLSGTMVFTPEQAINFILTLFGINVGTHAATNIAAIVGQFFGKKEPTITLQSNIEAIAEPVRLPTSEDGRVTPVETPRPKDADEDEE